MDDWPYYQLCNKYEAFPTKQVQEALLLLLTDEEEVLQLRLRCFMALAYQDRHNRDRVPLKHSISKYGYDALYTLQEEFNNPSISAMFFNVFLTTLINEEDYLDDQFLIKVYNLIRTNNHIQSLRDCTVIGKQKFIPKPEVCQRILHLSLHHIGIHSKLEVAEILFQYKILSINDLEYLLTFQEQLNINLYDFLANLPETGVYTRYRQMGRQGIERMNRDGRGRRQIQTQQINTGSQSVHQLDFHRTMFMKWLIASSFEEENDNVTKIINNWNQVNYARFSFAINNFNTKAHIKFEVSKISLNLLEIFRRIVFVIIYHKHRKELETRLEEECKEMLGTCTSGHLNRLFNTFIGFEEIMNIKDAKESYKADMRRELEQQSSDIKYNELTEAIIMAEWSDLLLNELKELSIKCHNETISSLKTRQMELYPKEEMDLYYEVVYKWSGVELKEKEKSESDTDEEIDEE